MNTSPRLGMELCGVIADSRLADGGDNLTSRQNFLCVQPVLGAIEAVSWLASSWCFRGEVTIICSLEPEHRVIAAEWLGYHKFFERTRLERHRLRFVNDTPAKVQLANDLCLTHFIDSRLSSIGAMHQIDYRFCLDPHAYERAVWQRMRSNRIAPHLKMAANWGELMHRLTSTLNNCYA